MRSASAAKVEADARGHVLIVDDDAAMLHAYGRVLGREGYTVVTSATGIAVQALLQAHAFDVVLCDIAMPQVDGIEVLRLVHEHDPDVPVILMTGGAELRSAVDAIEHGAFRYLMKPLDPGALRATVENAMHLREVAHVKHDALQLYVEVERKTDERKALSARFDHALETLCMAYQPIVRWSERSVFSHEALVRTGESSLVRPDQLFAAAEELDRVHDLGRLIRRTVAATVRALDRSACVFVNLHPLDVLDEELLSATSPLSQVASQIVLEITERASLEEVDDLQDRLAVLRQLGYRIALDDLGAGYAGLNSFIQMRPEVVKLDMALTRGIDRELTKQKLVGAMATLCRDLGMRLVAEGVETIEERDTLARLGCDLFQGYLFAKPGAPFPTVVWG